MLVKRDEDLANSIIELAKQSRNKRYLISLYFEEIEFALRAGTTLSKVIEFLNEKTNSSISLAYAKEVLAKERKVRKEKASALPNSKAAAPQYTLSFEQEKPEVQNKELDVANVIDVVPVKPDAAKESQAIKYTNMPLDELPESLKSKAVANIEGVDYDVRKPTPDYKIFGDAHDDFNFSEEMKKKGLTNKDAEYQEKLKVIRSQKSIRRLYFHHYRVFKSKLDIYLNEQKASELPA